MSKRSYSRRDFLRRGSVGILGLSVIAAVGCGSDEETLSCDDTSGLTPAELTARNGANYVATSPHGISKQCLNCNFGEAMTATSCGTCTVVKGPIHPNGYCDLWVAKT